MKSPYKSIILDYFYSKQDKSCMHFAEFFGLNALKISAFDVNSIGVSFSGNPKWKK